MLYIHYGKIFSETDMHEMYIQDVITALNYGDRPRDIVTYKKWLEYQNCSDGYTEYEPGSINDILYDTTLDIINNAFYNDSRGCVIAETLFYDDFDTELTDAMHELASVVYNLIERAIAEKEKAQ